MYEDTIESELKEEEGYLREMEISHIIETTIIHEIGHAIVDIDNCYIFHKDKNILDFKDEEEYVEDFARQYYEDKTIPKEMYELKDAFKGEEWIAIDPDYEFNY